MSYIVDPTVLDWAEFDNCLWDALHARVDERFWASCAEGIGDEGLRTMIGMAFVTHPKGTTGLRSWLADGVPTGYISFNACGRIVTDQRLMDRVRSLLNIPVPMPENIGAEV